MSLRLKLLSKLAKEQLKRLENLFLFMSFLDHMQMLTLLFHLVGKMKVLVTKVLEKKFMFNLKGQLLKRFKSNLIKYLGKGKSKNSTTFLFFSVVNWNIK